MAVEMMELVLGYLRPEPAQTTSMKPPDGGASRCERAPLWGEMTPYGSNRPYM